MQTVMHCFADNCFSSAVNAGKGACIRPAIRQGDAVTLASPLQVHVYVTGIHADTPMRSKLLKCQGNMADQGCPFCFCTATDELVGNAEQDITDGTALDEEREQSKKRDRFWGGYAEKAYSRAGKQANAYWIMRPTGPEMLCRVNAAPPDKTDFKKDHAHMAAFSLQSQSLAPLPGSNQKPSDAYLTSRELSGFSGCSIILRLLPYLKFDTAFNLPFGHSFFRGVLANFLAAILATASKSPLQPEQRLSASARRELVKRGNRLVLTQNMNRPYRDMLSKHQRYTMEELMTLLDVYLPLLFFQVRPAQLQSCRTRRGMRDFIIKHPACVRFVDFCTGAMSMRASGRIGVHEPEECIL